MSLTDGYLEPLGRCECCGQLVPEAELYHVARGLMLVCENCYTDPPPSGV